MIKSAARDLKHIFITPYLDDDIFDQAGWMG
jgi:hypothetical protein